MKAHRGLFLGTLALACSLLTMPSSAQWVEDVQNSTDGFLLSCWSSHFFDAQTGLVGGCTSIIPDVGDPKIIRTTDGGATWTVVYSGTIGTVRDIAFSTPMNGSAAILDDGMCALLRTTDGGLNWSEVSQNTDEERYVTDLQLPTNAIGYGVGPWADLAKTTDGGASWGWIALNLSLGQLPTGVHFLDENVGFMTCDGFPAGGNLYKTSNGGISWDSTYYYSSYDLSGVVFVDANTGFLYGGSVNGNAARISRTSDGGTLWQIATINSTNANNIDDMDFVSPSLGYCVTDNGKILKTVNGGATWNEDFANGTWVYTFNSLSLAGGKGYGFGAQAFFAINENVVGLPETTAQSTSLITSPNPVLPTDELRIEVNGEGGTAVVELLDVLGRPVAVETVTSKGLHISRMHANCPPGGYVLRLVGPNTTRTTCLIIQ
jgi:photosystem II stability/assembly factor-like uncharacterized protein